MSHDLHDYISQLGLKLDAEYRRIKKYSRDNPATAGDEGEENWAQLLRDWLPPTYSVVTKGHLIDEQGTLSPQIDVIVLKPSYPPSLHNKKKYLLAGVAAAFECKLTLRDRDIGRAVETGVCIKRMSHVRTGTPYRELVAQPLFGLLAHAYSRGRPTGDPDAAATRIDTSINAADESHVQHPREMIDLVCVANVATWSANKEPLSHPEWDFDPDCPRKLASEYMPATLYLKHSSYSSTPAFTPLGMFLTELLTKLAWEDASLRDIAGYFFGVDFSSDCVGSLRFWKRCVYSPELRKKISLKRLSGEITWDEWTHCIQ
jgi:hypothetical protein